MPCPELPWSRWTKSPEDFSRSLLHPRAAEGVQAEANSVARRKTHLWPQIAARYFSMLVQQPPSPPHRSASPHDAAATTGSPCLKEVSKYNQPLAYPLPLSATFWENPFLPKIIQMCFTARGEFVGKIRGSLDEMFPEVWGWELVPLWSRPAPLMRRHCQSLA